MITNLDIEGVDLVKEKTYMTITVKGRATATNDNRLRVINAIIARGWHYETVEWVTNKSRTWVATFTRELGEDKGRG